MKKIYGMKFFSILATLVTLLLASCGGSTPANVLISIQVTPALASIANGTTQQFTATGVYSDNTTKDITTTATWGSSNEAVVSVSSYTGLATSVAAGGPATITATLGVVAGTAKLSVTADTLVSIQVTPATYVLSKGTTQQFTATGQFSNNTTQDLTNSASWDSSNTGVASINSTSGLALAKAAGGPATITASFGGLAGTASVTVSSATLVSIQITPGISNIAQGSSQQLTATGVYSDNSTQDLTSTVTWMSGNSSVVSTSGGGLATGVSAGGPVTITATTAGVSGTASLSVSNVTLASITVTPAISIIAKGTTQQFIVTGKYSDNSTQDLTSAASWVSGNTAALTISSTGLATGVSVASSVTITATVGGISGTGVIAVNSASLISIQVTAPSSSFAAGTTNQFTATGTYSDNSTQNLTSSVSWVSSNTAAATISTGGLATGVKPGGSVTITATSAGVSGSANVTVTNITLVSIQVTPATSTFITIVKGTALQLVATGKYSDNSTQVLTSTVSWVSNNTAMVTVSSSGSVTGVTVGGPVTVTATLGSVSGAANLSVIAVAMVDFQPNCGGAVSKGLTFQCVATAIYNDGSRQDLATLATWASDNPTYLSVSSTGLITANLESNFFINITASYGGFTVSNPVRVGPASVISVHISPKTASVRLTDIPGYNMTEAYGIAQGLYVQFINTYTMSDGTTTTAPTYFNLPYQNKINTYSNGIVSGRTTGGPYLYTPDPTYNRGVTDTFTVTVLPAITSNAVSPASSSMVAGSTYQFSVMGTDTSSTTTDFTANATWVSSNTAIATVSSTGLVTAVGVGGPVTITATYGGVAGTATVTVVAPTTGGGCGGVPGKICIISG